MESVSPLFGDGSVPSFAQIALLWAPEVLAIRGSRDETEDEISISHRGLGTRTRGPLSFHNLPDTQIK